MKNNNKIKYVFLVNSFSIKNKVSNIVCAIKKYCTSKRIVYVIEINSKDRSTEDILKKYKKGKNIIVAVGGDGTLNRVLNCIVNTKNILSFIPCGVENNFFLKNKEIFEDEIKQINIIKINDKYFINEAYFGYKKISLIKRNELYIDLEPIDVFTNIVINNSIDEQFFNVLLMPRIYKLKYLLFKRYKKIKNIKKVKMRKLVIKSLSEIECIFDGERDKNKQYFIELVNKKINIYYNQDMIDQILKNGGF